MDERRRAGSGTCEAGGRKCERRIAPRFGKNGVCFSIRERHLAEVTVLDVRLAKGVKDTPAASALVDLHIPLAELRDRIDEVPTDKPIVALCRSGRRSALAVSILKEAGYARAATLSRDLRDLTQA